jgi:dTDP-4-dehydrorhamnose 3,5-epimerase
VIFREQPIGGVYVVESDPAADERGFFARTYCRRAFAEQGIPFAIEQASVSFNARRGTLRGMHLQVEPHEEAKLVRCLAGAVFDVVVDLRAGSPTQLQWLGVELSADGRNALYVPAGLAHGFLTLEDACELEYLISTPYEPAAAAGVRWDDPAIGIEWPSAPTVISPRDAAFADLDVERVRECGPAALARAGSDPSKYL